MDTRRDPPPRKQILCSQGAPGAQTRNADAFRDAGATSSQIWIIITSEGDLGLLFIRSCTWEP